MSKEKKDPFDFLLLENVVNAYATDSDEKPCIVAAFQIAPRKDVNQALRKLGEILIAAADETPYKPSDPRENIIQVGAFYYGSDQLLEFFAQYSREIVKVAAMSNQAAEIVSDLLPTNIPKNIKVH